MNLGEIKTEIKREFGDESGVQIIDSDIVRWTNNAMRDIVMQNDGLLETVATSNLVADQVEYTLPADLLRLHTIRAKSSVALGYTKLQGMSLSQFDIMVDGWDGNGLLKGDPQIYTLQANKIQLFPAPTANSSNGLKIVYSRYPVAVSIDADTPEIPVIFHNAIVSYIMQKAHSLDENWEAAGNMAAQLQADVNLLKNRDREQGQDFYPSITVLPEDL